MSTQLSTKITVALGLGLGSGLAPKAPGTAGSLVALLFFPLMVWLGLGGSLLLCLLLCVVGVPICGRTAKHMGVHDDGRIVFDEWAGQAISLLPIVAVHGEGFDAATFLWVLLSFGLFRFFDVIKPWPISWLDARVEGGLGIMIDDVVAGVFAALVLCAIMIGLGAIA